jgi:PPOX class probable F420-dependent enzyme
VWITGLDDGRLGFYTTYGTGKTKRLRHTSRVTLQPCSRSGKLKKGSAPTQATATMVHSGSDYDEVIRRVKAKYGLEANFFRLIGSRAMARKGLTYADTVVLIDPQG